jgi:hypothetical protein
MSLHPSELVLERLSVNDLPREVREETERHVGDCLSCRQFLGELEAEKRERLREVPPEMFMANLARRRKREEQRSRGRLMTIVAGAMLAAAAMVVVIPRLRETPGPGGQVRTDEGRGDEVRTDQVRLKGGVGVMVHRRRDDAVTALPAEARVRAGDGLRVVVTLDRATVVDVWFVDRQGRVDRLFESGAIELSPGQHALPGSAIVNDPCVDLWLVVATGEAATTLTEAEIRKLVVDGARDDASQEIQIRELGCE